MIVIDPMYRVAEKVVGFALIHVIFISAYPVNVPLQREAVSFGRNKHFTGAFLLSREGVSSLEERLTTAL